MLNVNNIIQSGGLLLITLIIFAESGLLAGFFLPGDTLLFSAGFLASQHKLPIVGLLVLLVLAAVTGYEVGYQIGHRFGKRLFRKPDGLFFRQGYLEKSEKFYEKHGGKTVLFSRFFPVIRTFAPVVAGIGNMDKTRYWTFNVLGGIIWTWSVTLLGYFAGSHIPHVEKYMAPAVMTAVVISFGPTIYHVIKDPKIRKRLVSWLRPSVVRHTKK